MHQYISEIHYFLSLNCYSNTEECFGGLLYILVLLWYDNYYYKTVEHGVSNQIISYSEGKHIAHTVI